MINKVVKNADDAVKDIFENATLMLGGFGLCGIPENCIAAFFTTLLIICLASLHPLK